MQGIDLKGESLIVDDDHFITYESKGDNFSIQLNQYIPVDDYIREIIGIRRFTIKDDERLIQSARIIKTDSGQNQRYYRAFKVVPFKVASHELISINVPGNGSCFYYAVNLAINQIPLGSFGDATTEKKLRRDIAEQIKNNLSDQILNYDEITTTRNTLYNPVQLFDVAGGLTWDEIVETVCDKNICGNRTEGDIESLALPIQTLFDINVLYIKQEYMTTFKTSIFSVGAIREFNPNLRSIILLYQYSTVLKPEDIEKNFSEYQKQVYDYLASEKASDAVISFFKANLKKLYENDVERNNILNQPRIMEIGKQVLGAVDRFKKTIPRSCGGGHYQVVAKQKRIRAETLFEPFDPVVKTLLEWHDVEQGTNFLSEAMKYQK